MGRVDGDRQTATVGEVVPISPAVKIADQLGVPVPGIVVAFSVDTGGDSITGATATTDDQGRAAVGSWTLGTTVGRKILVATSDSLPGKRVIFTATGTAGPPAILLIWQGNGQVVKAGREVRIRPAVRITDSYGNPVRGVQITFEVTAGGGQITRPVVTTGYNGVAVVGGWTLGTTPGLNTLSATAAGLADPPVSFSAEALLQLGNVTILVRNDYFRSDENGSGANGGSFRDWPFDTIPIGGSVTWIWEGQWHDVSGLDGYWGELPIDSSGNRRAPDTFGPIQFNTPGMYTYRCKNHSTLDYDWGYRGMLGRIMVIGS